LSELPVTTRPSLFRRLCRRWWLLSVLVVVLLVIGKPLLTRWKY